MNASALNSTPYSDNAASELFARHGRREVKFRYDLLRNNCPVKRLEVQRGSIAMRSDAEIKTSMNIRMAADDSINYITDVIAPYMLIGGQEFPLGRFLPATPVFHYSSGMNIADIECYDMGLKVKRNRALTRVFLHSGADLLNEVARLLNASDVDVADYVNTGFALPSEREDWDEDASYLEIINTLLSEFGYRTLFFNNEGQAVLKPAVSEGGTAHVYSAGQYSVVEEASSVENDMYSAYNAFRAVVSNPDLNAPLIAYAFITDINCPFSLANTGMRAAPLLRPEGITTQAALQSYVDRAAYAGTERTERVTITTALMPGHGVFDRILLDKANASGIYTETAWTMELRAGGVMTHTLERGIPM